MIPFTKKTGPLAALLAAAALMFAPSSRARADEITFSTVLPSGTVALVNPVTLGNFEFGGPSSYFASNGNLLAGFACCASVPNATITDTNGLFDATSLGIQQGPFMTGTSLTVDGLNASNQVIDTETFTIGGASQTINLIGFNNISTLTLQGNSKGYLELSGLAYTDDLSNSTPPATTPEPGSLVLLGTGLAALAVGAFAGKRRARRPANSKNRAFERALTRA